MTLEFSPPHANTPSIVLTARAISARLEEAIAIQVRIYLFFFLSLSFIGLELIIIFRPASEPHPRACPSHPPYQIESVFMKKEMARLKDSAPDLPHRER